MEAVVAHHLLVCLRATYDPSDPDTPYSLHHLAFQLRPPAGSGYPLTADELWLFARVEGQDEAELWVELVRLAGDDDPDDESVAAYGPYVVRFGAETVALSRAWCLRRVPFPVPGWYEFRLTQGTDVLQTASVYLED